MTGSKLAAVLLMAVGFALALTGLMTGFLPHSFGDTSCGSAFAPNPYIVWTTQCFPMTDSARTLALVLLVPGILAVTVGLVMMLASGKGQFSGMFHQPTLAELEARSDADA